MAAGGSGNATQETPWNYSSFTASGSDNVSKTTPCVQESIIPSILCLTIAPLCFIFFGIGLVVLMCRQHERLRQLLTDCKGRKRATGSDGQSPSEAPSSLLHDDFPHLSLSPQVGSSMSRGSSPSQLFSSYEFLEQIPPFNTPANTSTLSHNSQPMTWNASGGQACSYDQNRSLISVEAPLIMTTDSTSTVQSGASFDLEWDNFMPDATRPLQSTLTDTCQYPALKDPEYWV